MKRALLAVAGLCLTGAATVLAAADPFTVTAVWEAVEGREVVSVAVTIPPGHHLFADKFVVETLDEKALTRLSVIPSVSRQDQFSGQVLAQIEQSFTVNFGPPVNSAVLPDAVRVRYQGCSEKACFFPSTLTFKKTTSVPPLLTNQVVAAKAPELVTVRASGYLTSSEFLSFMDRAEGHAFTKTGGFGAALAGFAVGLASVPGARWILRALDQEILHPRQQAGQLRRIRVTVEPGAF